MATIAAFLKLCYHSCIDREINMGFHHKTSTCYNHDTTSLLKNVNKFDDASRKARSDFMLNGNGESVFHTMVKFQPLQELNAMNRAELMLSAGASAAGKNKEGRSTNKMSLNLLKHIRDRFDIINYEQDLLDIDGNRALHSVVRVNSQDVSFCQETTTVQNVAYEEKDFGADTVSSEHGKEKDFGADTVSSEHGKEKDFGADTVSSEHGKEKDFGADTVSSEHGKEKDFGADTVSSEHGKEKDFGADTVSSEHGKEKDFGADTVSSEHGKEKDFGADTVSSEHGKEKDFGADTVSSEHGKEKDFGADTVSSEHGKEKDFGADTVSSEHGKEKDFGADTVSSEHGKEKDFGADTVSSEHGREYVLKDLEPEDGKDHGQQKLYQKGTQGPDQGCRAESIPSACDDCQKLFKDSKQYFRNGDLEMGYHMLVRCLEFEHQSRRHKKIVNKTIALIVRKLGETTIDDIPDSLVTMSEALYCRVIEKLISGKKWIQVNAAIQKYCNRNGFDKMINFASTTNIVEKVIKDTKLRAQEEIKLQTVILMLDIGVSLDKHDGKRLARQAALIGHFKVVVELFKRGCAGDTPIHAAIEIVLQKDVANLKLLETLLCQFDADPEQFSFLNPSQVDAKGNGLFHLLAKCKFSNTALQAIEMLCARNLDRRVRNYEGKLPVEYIMNTDDQRKKFLCIAGSTEMPKIECNSTDTESGANKNATQIQIKDEIKLNIRETVKPSSGRKEQKRRIEEMIKGMERVNLCVLNQSSGGIRPFGGKIEASEKTLSLTLPEPSIVQAGMPIAPTEPKMETRENWIEPPVVKTEGIGSEDAVDRFAVEAEKGNEDEESGDEDEEELEEEEETEEITIDASVFCNLAWEVECTSDFWKKLRDNHITPDMKTRIIRRIQLLASGEWQPRLCKKLTKVPPNLQLYESKVSKAGRVIWEIAVAFSPRHSEMAERLAGKEEGASHPIIGGQIYSEIIRVWDIVLEHGKLYRSVQRSAKRTIQSQIIESYNRGLTCIIQKKLHRNSSLRTHTHVGHTIPMLFTEVEEDSLGSLLELQQKQLQQYFPPASPNETEYNIQKFYSFDHVCQYILQNLNTKVPLDLPFRVTDLENAIINLKSDAPILLLGRSGTGKTTCCLYRLCSQFLSYWIKAKEADAPLLPRTVEYVYLRRGEEEKEQEMREEEKKEEKGNEEDGEKGCQNDEKKMYMESGTVGVDVPEDSDCPQYDHIHQVFVTKNPVLCSDVQKKFWEFCNVHDVLHDHLGRAVEKLPSMLQDIDECSHPVFLTSQQLLLMLDASIGPPYFFERKKDCSLKIKVDSKREVTYEVFVKDVWPHIKKKMKVSYHPSLVWTEIMSFIKGSFEALSKPLGYLSKDEYIEIGRKRAPCFPGERDKIHEVFTCYNQLIKQKNLFDETDFVHNIFRRLQNIQMVPWVIHQIFVDETQDFTQSELCLLIHICQNPNQMFLTGDTAQSIMRGISFRFEDLKALFFHAHKSMQAMRKTGAVKSPKQYQLTHSYRSHAGILSLASSVLDLLDSFFPQSFDKLVRDQGLFNGPQPILLESCSFSDLAVLLHGNQQKTSQIEFGTHQAILVVNEAARDSVPEELQLGLILTIFEAKGLEFDDVLLYNFFKDSQASEEWRVVTSYLDQLWAESKDFAQGASTTISRKSLESIDQDVMQQKRRPRPLTFDYNLHKVLNSELKHLYTALTRARVNVWIFDEDAEKRTPMFEYFKALNLCKCITLEEMDKPKMTNTVFAEKSSATDWKCGGDYFMKHNLYEAAAKCYRISGETSKHKVALAHHSALVAGKMRENPRDMKDKFLKAAELFLECSLPDMAASCLQNARERELEARLYEKLGQFEKAARIYIKLKNPSESSRCYEILGNFNLAVQVLYENENYDSAIDTLLRYKMKKKGYESRGDQIPQILIANDPYENFNEEHLNFMLADFHHRHNNLQKMLETLERLPCWKDRVEFLKKTKYVDEAIQILEENDQSDEAVKLLLIHGRVREAVDSARKKQNGNTIAQTQLVYLQDLMTQPDKEHPSIEDQQQIVMEAKDLFESCRNADGSAEASLLLADLTDRVSHVEKAMNLFLELKPNPNLPGMLECVEWIVTHDYITKDNFMSLVRGFDHLFKVVQILCCAKTQADNELLSKYDSFYGLSTKLDKVIYFPKQKSRCRGMIKDLLPFRQEMAKQVEIELEKKAANERIALYLLHRAKRWLKNAVEEITQMRNEVQQCPYYQVGLPCPDIEKQEGRCLRLHCCHDRSTFDELMEIDRMFIELQRNIAFGARQFGEEKCPKSLFEQMKYFLNYSMTVLKEKEKVHKFTSCERILQDIMPISHHPHVLSLGYLSEVHRKMGIPIKEYLKAFMHERMKKETAGKCTFRTTAAKSADIFLMVGFYSHLFHIDFDWYEQLEKFENALSKEENGGIKHKQWKQLALIAESDTKGKNNKRDGKWIVQSLAHRFYDSYFHLTESDPLKALTQFTKFLALMWKKKEDVLPDPKFFLMWLEFYTTLSFFLIAKTHKTLQRSQEQFNFSFFVPASYLHLMDFIETTFPTHAISIQNAVCNWMIQLDLVKERLQYITKMLCGTVHTTSLVKVLFSPNLEKQGMFLECAVAERVLVLAMTLVCNIETFVSEQSVISLIQTMSQLQIKENSPERLRLALKTVHKAQCIHDVGTALLDLLKERKDPFMCCTWIPTRHGKDHRDHVHSAPVENAELFSVDCLATLNHGTEVQLDLIKPLNDHEEDTEITIEERMASELDTAVQEKVKRNLELGLKAKVQKQLVKEEVKEHLKIFNISKAQRGVCNISFKETLKPTMPQERLPSELFIGKEANADIRFADMDVQSSSDTVNGVDQHISSDNISDASTDQKINPLPNKNITGKYKERKPDAICCTQSSPVSRFDETVLNQFDETDIAEGQQKEEQPQSTPSQSNIPKVENMDDEMQEIVEMPK